MLTQNWVENGHPRTYGLLNAQNMPVLVLHDMGGRSLEHWLGANQNKPDA